MNEDKVVRNPWRAGGQFLFPADAFLETPLEYRNLLNYYSFGRDPDDDVTFREFILRESPTARRTLRALFEHGMVGREPDELESRYLALPDDGGVSWFDQRLPMPSRQPLPSGERRRLSEETKARWRRMDEERAARKGVTLDALLEERAERRREGKARQQREERAAARKAGIPVAEYRRQAEADRTEKLDRANQLHREWRVRKDAIRAELQGRVGESNPGEAAE